MTSSLKLRPLGYCAGLDGSNVNTSGRRPSASIAAIVRSGVGGVRGVGRIEFQHVWQKTFSVDRRDSFVRCVVADMAQILDEGIEPALPIVHRLAGVPFFLGFVSIEETAH